MGQTQWILPPLSAFSLLEKYHANVLPFLVYFPLERFEDEYNLIISILIIAHGYFTFSELTLRLAKYDIHYHGNSAAKSRPCHALPIRLDLDSYLTLDRPVFSDIPRG